jgi:ubiquinone/menaquinone biosynthesis C-methylase UbiE
MVTPDYEYHGFMAQHWDVLRGDTSLWDDRGFFLDVIERYGDPVLDVGCGTGRLLIDFRAAGWDIDGLDISPEMLEICEEKADALGVGIDVYLQPMEELDLPRQYATIMVPSSAFQLIVDETKASTAMQRFYDHLRPGGVLVMPFMKLWEGDRPPTEMPRDWVWMTEVTRRDGAVVRRSSKAYYDLEHNLEHTEDLYEVLVNGEVVEQELHHRSPATRGYDQTEAVALFAAAGFEPVERLSAWSFDTADDTANVFVVVGHKPG